MKIELKKVTIRDVTENYRDSAEEGVIGYDGKLNIRPKYQREYIYTDKKRDLVLETIRKGFPLNVMYWAVNEDGTFEVLDGQQRTISFCRYVAGDFSILIDGHPMAMQNLTKSQKDKILDYELMVYVCDGNDQDKLDWFKTINIAGTQLTPQEIRNAVYTGTWLTHAKSIFSKTGCPAEGLAGKYINGKAIHQEILERALIWVSNGEIEQYMSAHQHDPNANQLWMYFQSVIWWVQGTFTNTRKEMKSVEWGPLYDRFKDQTFDTEDLERRVRALMQDPDVTRRPGIYPYLLTQDERFLNIRQFDDREKGAAYERQNHKCANGVHCRTPGNSDGQREFKIEEMEGDHITPWSKGGKTVSENCQMLCVACNRKKRDA